MIDTIVLTLNSAQYRITNPEQFSPSAHWVMMPGAWANRLISKQNPSYKERAREIYKLRLSLSARLGPNNTQDVFLRIELSLPKLFFGNNVQELQYKDFRPCTHKLAEILAGMGVETTDDALANAPVSAIHYSKNIPLTSGYTPHYFINKIRQANVRLSLDTNQTHYRNDGHSYRWHCKSYEVIFYDKMRDLYKERPRSLVAKSRPKKLEILRMEVRLNKRQKIKQLFNALNIKSDYTFKKLFKPAISKRILLHYIDELERMRPAWLDQKVDNDKQLLAMLIMNNPAMGAKQILQMYGLRKILESMTIRELRTMLGNKQRTWLRLMADAKEVQLANESRPLGMIRDKIEKFKIVGKIT
jgi:hypothetical protein